MNFLQKLFAIKDAFFYSMSGLKFLVKERAFYQELLILPIVLLLIIIRDSGTIMKLYLVSSYFLILITEALNTAIEAVVDRVSQNFHDLSKKAKDIASAAVFMSFFHFVIVLYFYFSK